MQSAGICGYLWSLFLREDRGASCDADVIVHIVVHVVERDAGDLERGQPCPAESGGHHTYPRLASPLGFALRLEPSLGPGFFRFSTRFISFSKRSTNAGDPSGRPVRSWRRINAASSLSRPLSDVVRDPRDDYSCEPWHAKMLAPTGASCQG